MKKHLSKLSKTLFLILIIFIGLATNVSGQTSKGNDFWLMFPTNANSPTLTLFITSDVNTSGSISGPSFSVIPFSIIANTITAINVPVSLQFHTIDVVDNKGIHVNSLNDITVYGLNTAAATSDAYLALPTNALGTTYRVLTYQNVGVLNGTAFGMVASTDGTIVTITPSITTAGRPANTPYNITLNQGESYYLQHEETSTGDISGTLINSNHPIGVFGSHLCANVATNCYYCDHIVEMLPPVSTYGKKASLSMR